MDFGGLPPEINSARMYLGPGSAPMLAAAAAWDSLAAELSSTAATCESIISELTSEGWLGPASAAMGAAATPYMTWMKVTGGQAERAADQAQAAAGAFEAAYATTVPPAEVAANRALLAALVASNVIGQNTAAIASTEAQYSEMWAQDAMAMYSYAASSAVATVLSVFTEPPQITNPAGQIGQGAAVSQTTANQAASGVQSALAQFTSGLPNAVQSLALPAAPVDDLWTFLDSNFVNGFVSAGYTSPALLQQTVTGAMADINAVGVSAQPNATALPPMGAGFGNGAWQPIVSAPGPGAGMAAAVQALPFNSAGSAAVSADLARGALVGQLSVPQSWTAATQVANHAGTAMPGGGWTSTPTAAAVGNGQAAVPGFPGMPAAQGHSFGSGPRYGFRPTIIPRPPAAG